MGQWIRAPTLNPKTITNQVLGRSLSSRRPDSPNESRVAEERVDYWPGMPDYPDRPRRVASRKTDATKNPRLSRPSKMLDSRRRMEQPASPLPASDEPAPPAAGSTDGMVDTNSEWGVPAPVAPVRPAGPGISHRDSADP